MQRGKLSDSWSMYMFSLSLSLSVDMKVLVRIFFLTFLLSLNLLDAQRLTGALKKPCKHLSNQKHLKETIRLILIINDNLFTLSLSLPPSLSVSLY